LVQAAQQRSPLARQRLIALAEAHGQNGFPQRSLALIQGC